MAAVRVYEKQNSFSAMRHRRPVGDVIERIRRIPSWLAESDLSPEKKRLVAQACHDLLGRPDEKTAQPRFRLQTYVIEEMNRLTDAELPRYLFYRYRYEIFPQRKQLDDFPPCLQIEPTSICNYRCVFCYQTDAAFTTARYGHMGMMSLELFKRLIDQAEGSCEAITLASRGEPLLSQDLTAMLAYVRGKFLALKLNTNASRLTEDLCHAILEADVNTLVVSVDAAFEPAYSRLRVGGSLERVVDNVKRFQRIRTRHYPTCRLITRVAGVKVDGASDFEAMEARWGELVDQVAFVKYNPWEHVYGHPVNDLTTPCSDLWRRMFVWWDGVVNPCDVDYRSTLAVGNAKDQRVSALWRSEAYEQLRQKHLANQRSGCSPCQRCTVV